MLFKNLNAAPPFQLFERYYVKAEENDQPHVEAGCVSSVDANGQPHARYVNFKYFFEDNLIFFSNYKSDKAEQFENNFYDETDQSKYLVKYDNEKKIWKFISK